MSLQAVPHRSSHPRGDDQSSRGSITRPGCASDRRRWPLALGDNCAVVVEPLENRSTHQGGPSDARLHLPAAPTCSAPCSGSSSSSSGSGFSSWSSADIFRSRDMGGGAKALWVIFVIILPFLGIFVYLIARGGKMHERAEQPRPSSSRRPSTSYVKQTAGGHESPADQLAKLADLKDQGRPHRRRVRGPEGQDPLLACTSAAAVLRPPHRATRPATAPPTERPSRPRGSMYYIGGIVFARWPSCWWWSSSRSSARAMTDRPGPGRGAPGAPVILDLVLIGLVITLEPIPLTAFILVLTSKGGVRKGAAFIFGWLRLAGHRGGRHRPGHRQQAAQAQHRPVPGRPGRQDRSSGWCWWSSPSASGAKMGQPKKPKKTPKWQTGIDNMSPWYAMGLAP